MRSQPIIGSAPTDSGAGGGGPWGSGDIVDGSITAADIAAGTVTGADIATATITATNIAPGTITSANIADGAITATDIATGTITSANIADGTIAYTDLAAPSVATVVTTHQITVAEPTVLANSTGGAYTVTLPSATAATGRSFAVKRLGANTVTVTAAGGQTIDGSTTYGLTQANEAVVVTSDGANWFVV